MLRLQTPLHLLRSLIVLGSVACGGSSVTDTPDPTPPVDTTKPGPTVQRASITARVTIDPVDASLAQQAGIGVGGLTVRLTSSRAGEPVRTAVTGADGTARFDNLLEASYSASVERRLTTEELAKLPPADREASMFAGGVQVVLSPPTGRSVDVPLVGARRGSIIISEIFAYYGPPERGFDNYVYGTYMEVFNNADTTAYLDGILYGQTSSLWHYSSDTRTCDALPNSLRLDSAAVYATPMRAFPGSGRDFPIRPGETKVVAMDAINHATAAPVFRQVDLSRADFEEFWTDADVDNPFAVNMVRVYGGTAGVFGRGYGFMIFGGSGQLVLLAPGARTHLTEVTVPNAPTPGSSTFTFGRLPSEYILDVLALSSTIPLTGGSQDCAPWTSPKFDRAPAPLRNFLVRQAVTRRSLGHAAGGNEILQRTRNSARDFMLAEPLKRSLDK